jgi:haloalkane dehalogenase
MTGIRTLETGALGLSEASSAIRRPGWLVREEYPFRSRFLNVEGQRIHYVDEGTGPTLLFVHAGPAWSFVYRDVIILLRDEFRCVALDFPGTGPSPALSGYDPGMEAASQVLEAFVRALDLREVTLVVHDLGGPVAFGTAARLPDRFVAVAVTESFGWPLAGENPKIARALGMAGGRIFGLVNVLSNLLARVTATRYGLGRHLTALGRSVFREPFRDRRVRRYATAMLHDAASNATYLRTVDLALRTTLSGLPLLLVFGKDSPTVEGGFPAGWAARFPDAPLFLLEGAHHFPMMDDPAAVSDVIGAWWDDSVAGGLAE